MEETIMRKFELLDHAHHLLDLNIELLQKIQTLKTEDRTDIYHQLNRLRSIIDDCIEKIHFL